MPSSEIVRGLSTRRVGNAARSAQTGRSNDKLLADWWEARIARQKEIDASIAAKAEFEYLYDKPVRRITKTVRVAGPFTVESLSARTASLGVDENDELIDPLQDRRGAAMQADSSR